MGLSHPKELGPEHIYRRVSDSQVKNLAEVHEFLPDRALLTGITSFEEWAKDWRAASERL